MTKKHFILLADFIKDAEHDTMDCEAFSDAQIRRLAVFCKSVNPMFNTERWIAYINGECGPNGGKI